MYLFKNNKIVIFLVFQFGHQFLRMGRICDGATVNNKDDIRKATYIPVYVMIWPDIQLLLNRISSLVLPDTGHATYLDY